MSHPHVVSVYGADRLDGTVGVWMELIEGRTLDATLSLVGPLSEREACGVGIDVCGAIAAIHGAGLIHRDIKAQNVMRERGGRVVLMDMGASIAVSDFETATASLAGTPLYMAPELFEGARPSAASDIYAIGVLLYRLVTAEFPIEAPSIGGLRRAHAEPRRRPLRELRGDLGPDFVRLVERCLAPDAAARYPHVSALEQALHDAATPAARAPYSWTGWRVIVPAVVAAVAGVALTWAVLTRRAENDGSPAPEVLAISPEQYKVFAGYEELAFNQRTSDPSAAAAASAGAMSQIRLTLFGNRPVFALLYARLAESWRRAGKLTQAGTSADDAAAHTVGTVGEDHPYTAVVAMEWARQAQARGDHRKAAAEILRALQIRWQVLGLADIAQKRSVLLDAAALEHWSQQASSADDTDGDGLIDLIEAAAGLNPQSNDSDRDGVFDDDEDHDGDGVRNRLALGLMASPFLTWAHSGAYEPRDLVWQTPVRFPMSERGDRASRWPSWSLIATQGQGYFHQRLSAAHAARAVKQGFSLVARTWPDAGLTSLALDSSTRRTTVRLVDSSSRGQRDRGPVALEHCPSRRSCRRRGGQSGPVAVAGTAVQAAGSIRNALRRWASFADRLRWPPPVSGGVRRPAWSGGSPRPATATHAASARFNLVWLEIF